MLTVFYLNWGDEVSELKNLFAALAKAQGAIEAAKKTKENPAFSRGEKKSTYADIAEVIEVIQKPASENGLSVIFNYSLDADVLFINYVLMHSSGETMTGGKVPMFLRDKTMHGFGASNTFMRRQLLKSIYQIPEEDDDGNSQSMTTPPPHKPVPKPIPNVAPKPPPPPKEEKYDPETYFQNDDELSPEDRRVVIKEKMRWLQKQLGYSDETMKQVVFEVTKLQTTQQCDNGDLLSIVDYLNKKLP